MAGGRPSLYKPEYCQRVIDMGSQGFSVVEMAANLGVVRITLETQWTKDHPEFSVALKQARELCQAWWEKKGREGMETPGFNAAVWSRSMAARFPKDWTDRKQVDTTATVQIEHQHTLNPAQLSNEQREALRGILQAALPPPDVEDGEFTEVD